MQSTRMTEIAGARKLADFEGQWRVERFIQPKEGPEARFLGTALWAASGTGLSYHETGLMTLDGHAPMQAERRYFWADDLSVYFDDGRFFHRVPETGGLTEHWCDPDSYALRYDFGKWPQFRVNWNVTGPRKDYRAETEYTRC